MGERCQKPAEDGNGDTGMSRQAGRERRKGILLVGGSGTRLYPITKSVSKQLLQVYDKPMVYYALSTLMLADIQDVVIISAAHELARFENLLGDGSQFGMRFTYVGQPSPDGIAQALILAEEHLDGAPSALMLGDNLFFGNYIRNLLITAASRSEGATVFAYAVSDPERYGVVSFDENRKAVEIEEKPQRPKSHYAVTGLYFYDHRAPELARSLKPSARGELEITDLNRLYLEEEALSVEVIGRGVAWFDTGTPDSLLEAGQFIAAVERRQGLKIGCPEEIAWRAGWIDDQELSAQAEAFKKSAYGQYLAGLLSEPPMGGPR